MADPAEVLGRSKTIAVVGFSQHPSKTAHAVPVQLIAAGFNVIPVNPNATEILGRTSYPTLNDVSEPIDLVNVFRPSEFTPEVARRAVQVGAKALWLQQDIVSEEARRIATDAGLDYIEDTCIAVVRSVYRITRH